jgi:hypothetical protein
MPFSVCYQLDRDVVDSRILGKRSVGEFRELLVVAAGEVGSNLPDVLLDDVGVVEQPLSRRADVDAAVGSFGQPVTDLIQDSS